MGNVGPTPTGNIFLDTIDRTVDPTLPSPTSQIFGSSSGVADANGVATPGVPTNEERADALFPFFDGVNEKLTANPVSLDGLTEYLFDGASETLSPEFDANGNPLTQVNLFQNSVDIPGPADIPVEDFFSFHSSHQLEYIDQFGTPISGTGGKIVTLTQGGNRFDVVSSPDGRRVFILQQLTKADIAILSREDQDAIAGALDTLPANTRAELENVIGAQAGQNARDVLNLALQLAKDEINDFFDLRNIANNPFNQADVDAARAVFVDQINNIGLRAEASAFINQAEINTRLEDITRRAERANAFFVTSQNPPFPSNAGFQQVQNINSLDRDGFRQPTIENGFKSFIAQETRIRDLDNQRLQLARTGFLNGGRALDGPNLIAIFQLNYNLVREAEVNAETEELTQQNALLRDYAAVQQLVNDALSRFPGGEDGADQTRNILGQDNSGNTRFDDASIDDATRDKIAFFEDQLTLPDNIRHPIETLRGINRPQFDLVKNSDGTLNEFSQNQLNIFASQLADAVTQINQESQILTNEISNLNRERNRHFDLANNALRRLNDSLQTIARI